MGKASPPIYPADDDHLELAASYLRQGQIVSFPTETVYGLGADACNSIAVARIFEAKGRPTFNPLIVHVADLDQAQHYGRFDDLSLRIARALWPGPLSIVVPRTDKCALSQLVSAGLETVALRIPAHPVAQSLLKVFGGPIAAPSANLSTEVSPTRAEHVAASLDTKVSMVLDGGPCQQGLESTIVMVRNQDIHILRPGIISREDLENRFGCNVVLETSPDKIQSPGQMLKHYAPHHKVRLNANSVESDEALLAFGDPCPGTPLVIRNLSPSGDLVEAAANLFAYMRELDDFDSAAIAVMPIPDNGIGEAINDRLRRAARS